MRTYKFLKEWIIIIFSFLRTYFITYNPMRLEIVALRSQLALYNHQVETGKRTKPKSTPAFRQLWVLYSKHCSFWKSILIEFKPNTIMKWHRSAFKFHWMFKSRKIGRPTISNETITLIKRLHKKNPLLSPEKIHEKLVLL